MNAFLSSLRKETLLLVRDWHALLVLFAMPSLFVLIMSMALQERFEEGGVRLPGYLVMETDAESAREFLAELEAVPHLDLTPAAIGEALRTGDALYELRIPAYFEEALDGLREGAGLYLRFAPELSRRDRVLIEAAVREAFARYNTLGIARELGYDRSYAETELLRQGFIAVEDSGPAQTPSAVQQSVSAWLIFAMFFIAIPISTTVIQERQQRTLMRLRTFGLPVWVLYSAKLFPYFVVNLLQLLAMLIIGIALLPLLGAQGLSLSGVSLGALLAIGASTSLAALALASLIATVAHSVEQATVASGALNIVFAALGGIMIPTFVMPPALQTIAQVSPMAWALEGFLDVLVRGATYGDIAKSCALLLGGAIVLWLASAGILKRGADHD
jgi:ABC-2 type transport system permease protein